VCKDAVCVELACRVCKMTLTENQRQMLIKRSGAANGKIYQQTLVRIRTSLGIKIGVSIRDVAVQFGVVSLLPFAQTILIQYKKRCRNSVLSAQRQFIKFDNPAFQAAALSLGAAKRKIKHFDDDRLVSSVGSTVVEFKRIRTSMIEVCEDLIGAAKKKKTTTTRKRSSSGEHVKKTKKGSGGAEQMERENHLDMEARDVIPGYEDTSEARAAKARREYQEWRKSVLEERRKEKEAAKRAMDTDGAACAGGVQKKKKNCGGRAKRQKTLRDAFAKKSDACTGKRSKATSPLGDVRNQKGSELDRLLSASFA